MWHLTKGLHCTSTPVSREGIILKYDEVAFYARDGNSTPRIIQNPHNSRIVFP